MTIDATVPSRSGSSTGLSVGLWIAQIFAAFVFCFAGFTKVTTPIPHLAAMIRWAGAVPETFVRFIGLVDLAGGLGLFLPALTRILPRLTVLAALGCTILQVLAACFHISRGEFGVLPLNAILLGLSIFILWGRELKAPIRPRG